MPNVQSFVKSQTLASAGLYMRKRNPFYTLEQTMYLWRGTPVYMAPEIHNDTLVNASLADLMKTDIWSLGILAYAMINPNLINPYDKEVEASGGIHHRTGRMKLLMERKKLPVHDPKYESRRITEWWHRNF